MEGIAVGYEFIDVLDIDVVAGRNFSRSFASDTNGTVLLNERAVEALGLEQPVGQRLQFRTGTFQIHVVGVVKDFHFKSLHHQIEPMVLFLIPRNSAGGLWALAKIRGERVRETMAFMERTWLEVNPGYPFEFQFLDEAYDQSYRAEDKFSQVLGYFTGVALLIACLGLFGLVAFTAEQRTKEIGIRKVLGASVGTIIALIAKDFIKLVGAAFVLAMPAAYLLMQRWLDTFAYRVEISARIFLLAGLAALGIALLTVSYQSVRAALADPVQSLRYE